LDKLAVRGSQRAAIADYRPDIDGLRAIAVISVVLYHANVPLVRSGFVGVDIFFVISGFLIGRIVYLDTREGSFSFGTFYARRLRRIVPALLVVVISSLFAGLAFLSASELKDVSWSALTALLGVSNIHFWKHVGYFTPGADLDPLLMTWTLGVEEQFYILFPFFLFALRRFGASANILAILLLTVASLAVCLVLTDHAPTAAFYLIQARAWEFGIGVMLAIWMASGKSFPYGAAADVIGAVGLISLIASVCLFSDDTPWPGLAAVLPVSGTAALLLSQRSIVNRFLLSARLLVGVGLISYSWYLWHWPIMTFIRVSTVRPPPIRVMLAAAAISLVLAIVSWRYIEQPFRLGTLSKAVVLTRYPIALMAALCLPIFILAMHGLPSRLPSSVAAIDKAIDETHSNPCLNYGESWRTQCVSGVPNRPTLAVLGDSHAAALGPAIQALAQSANWGFAVLAKSSCRPLKGVTVRMQLDKRFAAQCANFTGQALQWVAQNPSVRSVILAGQWTGPITNPQESYQRLDGMSNDDGVTLLAQGLQDAILELRGAGKRVFVVEDVPYWPFSPARAMRSRSIPVRNMVQRIAEPNFDTSSPLGAAWAPPVQAEARLRRAAEQAGANYMLIRRSLCFSDGCLYRKGEVPLFADQTHLTAAGARIVVAPYRSTLLDDSKSN
jgi:peptidoglycan/LPS O-acetylase OafA/YrhL